MQHPMTAIGNVTVGKAEYGAGEVFDALTEQSRDYLLQVGAAVPASKGQAIPAIAVEETVTADGEAIIDTANTIAKLRERGKRNGTNRQRPGKL